MTKNSFKSTYYITFLLLLFLFNSCNQVQSETKKEIKASEIIKLINKGKHVQISDKIIMNDLDFSAIEEEYVVSVTTIQKPVKSNIFFLNCVFMGDVTATGRYEKMIKTVSFQQNVTFFGCDFRGNVNFENAVFKGEIDFSRSVFRGNTSFNEITVFGKRNSFIETTSESSFNMINALFHGNLNFMDSKFDGSASFQSIIANQLQFSNVNFSKRVDFSNLTIRGNSFFNYVEFQENVDFSFSTFYGNLDIINTKFQENVNFSDSFNYKRVRFNNSSFEKNVNFEDSFFVQMPLTENVNSVNKLMFKIVETDMKSNE